MTRATDISSLRIVVLHCLLVISGTLGQGSFWSDSRQEERSQSHPYPPYPVPVDNSFLHPHPPPRIPVPADNPYLYHPSLNNNERCVCNCNLPEGTAEAPGCEWKMVFKAVQGNGRHVYNDWVSAGGINTEVPEAMTITSTMPYRDGTILDRWNQHYIQRVKMEVYSAGIRNTWFYFDATASTITSWMQPGRFIASPYNDLKDGTHDVFSVAGEAEDERRFHISRDNSADCSLKCGYIMVIDPQDSHDCTFENVEPEPLFLYGIMEDSCALWNNPIQHSVGDRFVISVKVCDAELSDSEDTNWVDPPAL